jgi:hypothetical protein
VNGCNVVAEFTISSADGMLDDETLDDEGQSYLDNCNDAIIADGISSCRCVIGDKVNNGFTVDVVCTDATVIETDAITVEMNAIDEIARATNFDKNTSITYEVFTCSSPSQHTNCEEVCGRGNTVEIVNCASMKENGRIRVLPNFNELERDYYNQENYLATDPLTQENIVTDSWSQETYDASSMFNMRQLRDLESQAEADAQIKEVP